MTEDPVKLYVIVMAILLCVLAYVAYDSYQQAYAYEAAIDRAPREAEQMQTLVAEVKALVKQIAGTTLAQGGEKVLIERVERNLGISHSGFEPDTASIGPGIKGREKRYIIDFGGGRSSPPLPRSQVVKFCEGVERASSGIVKTIELRLSRATGENYPDPGKEERVLGDAYKGRIVFGLRVVD